jgi:hypothetical protein
VIIQVRKLCNLIHIPSPESSYPTVQVAEILKRDFYAIYMIKLCPASLLNAYGLLF